MKKALILISATGLFLGLLNGQTYFDREIIRIEKNREVTKELLEMNCDLLMEKDGDIYVVASAKDMMALQTRNIPFTIESHKFYPQGGDTFRIQSGVTGEFHSYAELEQDLIALAEAYPDLAQVIDIGDSLEQRNIYALKISDNVGIMENEASVVFLGCHHAREWISIEVPYLLGKYLVENYATDTEVARLVNNAEIWIVPLVNPDGLEYSIHFYRYWRKNMRDNGNGTFGVDINRNYGYMWGYDNLGSSPNTGAEVYRGEAPFSEPESRAVRGLFEQNDFMAMVSYHSYSQVILYPWGYTEVPSDEDAVLSAIGNEMSRLMEPVNGRYYEAARAGDGFYLTNGDTTDWSFGVYGIPSYTIELPPTSSITGEFFNAESDIQPIFAENLPAALYIIDWCIKEYPSQAQVSPIPARVQKRRIFRIK
jgi:carboxypeptidase T